MKTVTAVLVFVCLLPILAIGQAQIGAGTAQAQSDDSPIRTLAQPLTPRDKYLLAHPKAKELGHAQGRLRFRNETGTVTSILGSVTHQDPQTGTWVANAPVLSQTNNGWRLDGTSNGVVIRKQGSDQHTITQTYTDFGSKHDSTLTLTVPVLVYDKDLGLHFTSGGIPWALTFSQTGVFDFVGMVTARQGKKTYVFGVDSSENLNVNANGDVLGNAAVNLSRAVMIPKTGKRVPCSPWTYSKKDGGSFTCDDSVLKDSQLPYRIDPSSQTLIDRGTFYIDFNAGTCNDNGEQYYCQSANDANVNFTTSNLVPVGGSYIGESCSEDILSIGGDGNVECTASTFNPSGTTAVRVFITGWDGDPANSFGGWANVTNITLAVTYNDPPAPESISAPPAPSGPVSGTANTSYTYSASGASSTYGHQIQYQFNWGDNTTSGWLQVGTISANHSWALPGSYNVRVQARCVLDTGILSSLSTGLAVYLPPPSSNPDPRRTGVRSTGTYWGAAGEQIDLLSGNLNFAIPFIRAQARGGWGVTFALAYNSQIWRQVAGSPIALGRDIGYGYGWTLQAGAIRPAANLHAYVFVDATGAEYLLDRQLNGVWTSRQGTYVSFDDNDPVNPKLYFPDGSFWIMSAKSASGEPDAETRYPTIIEDSNGNLIKVVYDTGAGGSGLNTSGRITQIFDSRTLGPEYAVPAYAFTYSSGHLASVRNNLGTPEAYTLDQPVISLQSPFSPPGSFGSVRVLQSVTMTDLNIGHTFQYSPGTAELAQVTNPNGGILQWDYRTYTYSGSLAYREVQTRRMQASSGATSYTWNLTNDSNSILHATAKVADAGTGSSKVWTFRTDAGTLMGMAGTYEELDSTSTILLHKDYSWTAITDGNPYLSAVQTTLSPGTTDAATSKTTQTLDIYGNLTQSQVFNYGDLINPARTYTYQYLHQGNVNYLDRYIRNRVTSVTLNPGNLTLVSNSYDTNNCGDLQPQGALYRDSAYGVSFVYRGNVTVKNGIDGWSCIAYQITGVPYKTQDPAGRTTGVTTSAATGYSLPEVVTPGGNSNLATSLSYASSWQIQSVTGPNGAGSSTIYDAYGRPSSSTSPDGAGTAYVYGTNPPTQTVTVNNRWAKTTFDGFGRVVKAENGHDGTTVSVVDTEYAPCACSPLGKLYRVSQPHPQGPATAWTYYYYDGSGRTLRVVAADGSTTYYTYQGNKTTVTDPAGKWKKFTNDGMGNLVTVTEPNPAGGEYTTTYTYSVLNQLTGVSMPRGGVTQTRTFGWTGLDMTSATNPENGTVTTQYNAAHQVTHRTDAKGQVTQYSYDTYGRLTQVRHYPNMYSPELMAQRVEYTYDQNRCSPSFSQNAWGRLAATRFGKDTTSLECDNFAFSYQYSYNTAGRVTTQRFDLWRVPGKQDTSTPVRLEAGYGWDNEGRMTSLTYPTYGNAYVPDGRGYGYQYDVMGRLSTMTNTTLQSTVATATYGTAGELATLSYDGFAETRTYNSLLQLTRITALQSGTTAMDMEYVYPSQNNGRIWKSIDHYANETVTYQYDSLNRLIQAETSGTEWGYTYGYDGFGNLLSKGVIKGQGVVGMTQVVDGTTNRVSGVQYDANGNPAHPVQWDSGPETFPYDGENRLLGSPYNGWGFTYDPSGKRVYKSQHVGPNGESSCEIYFYGLGGKKLATYACGWKQGQSGWLYIADGFEWKSYDHYFGGKQIRAEGVTVVTDRLGSVRMRSNGQRMSYYPYGEERTATANDGSLKFGSYLRDADGMDYADQRYYASGMGRFMTADPLGVNGTELYDPMSWNRYGYVGGDPVNFVDTVGTIRELVGSAICGTDEVPYACEIYGPASNGDEQRGKKKEKRKPTIPVLGGVATDDQKQKFSNGAKDAEDKLRKKPCANLFGEGDDGLTTLEHTKFTLSVVYYQNTTVPDVDPIAVTEVKDGVPTGNATINILGSFFGKSPIPGLSDTDFRAFVLLHELGHLTGVLGDDRKDEQLATNFNIRILSDCFGLKN